MAICKLHPSRLYILSNSKYKLIAARVIYLWKSKFKSKNLRMIENGKLQFLENDDR